MRQQLWLQCEGHSVGELMSQMLLQDRDPDRSILQAFPRFLITDEVHDQQLEERLDEEKYQLVGMIGNC